MEERRPWPRCHCYALAISMLCAFCRNRSCQISIAVAECDARVAFSVGGPPPLQQVYPNREARNEAPSKSIRDFSSSGGRKDSPSRNSRSRWAGNRRHQNPMAIFPSEPHQPQGPL
eukprot:8253680-Pyramimonas_sp.AAC.1